MSFGRGAAACLLVLFSLSTARAESVDVFVDAASPPVMSATADNTPVGIYPALIVEAFARAGITANLKAVPWTRAVAKLDAGKGAIGGIYKNAARLNRYDYSDEISVAHIHAVVLKAKAGPFPGIEFFRGGTVGVLRGWSYGDAFDQASAAGAFRAEAVDNDAQNLAKLKAGRIDVLLASGDDVEIAIAETASPGDYAILEPPLLSMPTHLAFAKSTQRLETIAAFNRGLAAMKADGAWDRIVTSFRPVR